MVTGLLLVAAAASASEAAPRPVIVVADVGVDDAAALLWALGSPKLEVLGIASSLGCHSDARETAKNARRLLNAANRTDVPVFIGSRYPLGTSEPLEVDGSRFHGPTGFGDPPGPEEVEACSAIPVPNISAAEFIVRAVRERPGGVTILSFSPLTDVALALLLEPRLPSLISSLVLMGAAVYTHGNAQPLAEANFLHDALAAQLVVRSFTKDSRLVIVPLDVTMSDGGMVSPAVVEQIARLGHAGRLFARAWTTYARAYCEINRLCGAVPLHDALTVAYAVDPGMFTRSIEVVLHVIVAPGTPAHGQSFVDQRAGIGLSAAAEGHGSRATLLLGVDGERFTAGLVAGISGIGASQGL